MIMGYMLLYYVFFCIEIMSPTHYMYVVFIYCFNVVVFFRFCFHYFYFSD